MVKRDITKKGLALTFSILLVLLIFSILIPPATAVTFSIGDVDDWVYENNPVTFENVNITIEAVERIPLVELNFSIYNNNDELQDYILFNVDGSNITDSPAFTITRVSPSDLVLASWRTTGRGYDISYGYWWGEGDITGYGYGNPAMEQIIISYSIEFDTDDLQVDTDYYAVFTGTATTIDGTLNYISDSSETKEPNFDVKRKGTSGGGGGGSGNTPPTADAGGPYVGAVGQPITLDGGDSTDANGWITGYKWDFTSDGVYDTEFLTSETTTHSYGSPGTYTVKLMVQDNGGATSTATATVTITGEGKSPPIAHANGPYNGLTSAAVQFDGSKSYDPDGTIVNYTWDLGDGSIAYTQNPTHLYPNEGEYTITLTVKDNDDLSDLVTTELTVLLDTDGDGWSDILEKAYGTSETSADEQPTDNDNDGIPDDDSPDGTYIGDPDDDDDGLDDDIENDLGSDPLDETDVIALQIEGTTYYLIDTDKDTVSDTLFNPYTEGTTEITEQDGKLYLDTDDDGTWEYIYDPVTQETSVYTSPKQDEGFPFAVIILLIVIIIIIGIAILFKTGFLYIERIEDKKKK